MEKNLLIFIKFNYKIKKRLIIYNYSEYFINYWLMYNFL